MIGDKMRDVKNDPKTVKFSILLCANMLLNAYSSVIIKDGKTKLLRKAVHNIRELRQRPEESQKD